MSSQLYPYHNHEVDAFAVFLFTAWYLLFLAFRMTALNSSDYLMKRLRALNLMSDSSFAERVPDAETRQGVERDHRGQLLPHHVDGLHRGREEQNLARC